MASIEKGHPCSDAEDFIDLLRWWAEKTDESTIGDVGTYGGTSWVRVLINGVPCHLNADSRREGVQSFLYALGQEGPRFAVVANSTGRNVNRVVLGASREPMKYFYLYTDENLPYPTDL